MKDDRCPIDGQVARCGLQGAAQDLQQGRLPSPVVTHEADHLAWVDLDIDVVEGDNAAEHP